MSSIREIVIETQGSVTPIMNRLDFFIRENLKGGKIFLTVSRESICNLPTAEVVAIQEAPKPARRTIPQNKALHLFCSMLAEKLNDSGYDMRRTLKQDVDIPWSGASVKEYLWRPLQIAITGDESTTKPAPSEYTKIYEVLSRHLGEKLGVHVEWPCEENQIRQARIG